MVAVQEGSLSSAFALDDSGAVRRPPVEQLAALATDGIERALKRASISPMCWGWRDQETRAYDSLGPVSPRWEAHTVAKSCALSLEQ